MLQEAISKEDYEKASEIRDELNRRDDDWLKMWLHTITSLNQY
jgi:hypothetical protein